MFQFANIRPAGISLARGVIDVVPYSHLNYQNMHVPPYFQVVVEYDRVGLQFHVGFIETYKSEFEDEPSR